MESEIDCAEVVEHIQKCERCRAWLISVIAKAANLEFLNNKDNKES